MSWLNLIALIFLLPNVKKMYDDFFQQLKPVTIACKKA